MFLLGNHTHMLYKSDCRDLQLTLFVSCAIFQIMKVAVSLLLLVLIVTIEATRPVVRSKRGFRLGAADRFSHGFGKRQQDSNAIGGSTGDA